MDGRELFEYYTSKRDFSGSNEDEYAQLLNTIFLNVREEIFPLMEKAEVVGKKLNFDDLKDEFTIKDVFLT